MPAGAVNYFWVSKVGVKCLISRIQQSSTRDERQREDVQIVGDAGPCCVHAPLRFMDQASLVKLRSTCSRKLHQQPSERRPVEFLREPSTQCQSAPLAGQPSQHRPCVRVDRGRAYLMRRIRIDDDAHILRGCRAQILVLDPKQPALFLHGKIPISGRHVFQVPIFINAHLMNHRFHSDSLEK